MAGTSPAMTAMQISPELAFVLTLALRMAFEMRESVVSFGS